MSSKLLYAEFKGRQMDVYASVLFFYFLLDVISIPNISQVITRLPEAIVTLILYVCLWHMSNHTIQLSSYMPVVGLFICQRIFTQVVT